MSADDRRRHHAICARTDQFAFGLLCSRTGDNVHIRVQIASSQNYVHVIRIVRKTTRKTARVLHACIDQTLFERRISAKHGNAVVHQLFDFLLIALDYNEDAVYSAQTSYQVCSDSSGAADDKMISQFAHFS